MRGRAPPIVASFRVPLTLALVTSGGPVTIQWYDPAAISNLAFPIGFYIDRLSAVAWSHHRRDHAHLSLFHGYMYQDRGYRRYLGMLGLTTAVLLCMVSSANLVMLFIFWQILSWLLFLLGPQSRPRRHPLRRRHNTFTMLRLSDAAFLAGIVSPIRCTAPFEFQTLFTRAPRRRPSRSSSGPNWVEMKRRDRRDVAYFRRRDGQVAQFLIHTWLPRHSTRRRRSTPQPYHGHHHAGGFLLNRLAPLRPGFESINVTRGLHHRHADGHPGATMMLTQNDIKKTLGFSGPSGRWAT